MNLWVRLGKWALVSSCLALLSCENPNQIGAELNPNDDNFAVLFKEFSLPSSVVYIDSIITDVPLQLLVGAYDDPNFGRTEIISYTQLQNFDLQSGLQTVVAQDAEFDSAKLFLQIEYFVGENFNQPQQLKIHTLEDTLFLNVNYKSSLVSPISNDPVGILDFSPSSNDTLLIVNMKPAYGQRMLQLAKEEFITTATIDKRVMNNVIPGMAFVPGPNNSIIVAINDNIGTPNKDRVRIGETSVLRIYYHLDSDSGPEVGNFDYSIGEEAFQYMYAKTSRVSSKLSEVRNPLTEYYPANGLRYVQPISGISTKIDMSEVWDFIKTLDGFVVNYAQLLLTDVTDVGGPDDTITILDNFSLLFTGKDNKVVSNGNQIFTSSVNKTIIILTDGSYNSREIDNPLRVKYDQDEAAYEAELSNYIQAVADSAIVESDLMMFPLVRNTSTQVDLVRPFDQLIFEADKLKLRLYYSTIQ